MTRGRNKILAKHFRVNRALRETYSESGNPSSISVFYTSMIETETEIIINKAYVIVIVMYNTDMIQGVTADARNQQGIERQNQYAQARS